MHLLEPCGTLLLEEEGGPVIPTCIKSAEQHDVATEKLSSQEVQERYPLFPNANLSGLLEPGGGFVRPETAMYAALSEAKARGATLWEKATVQFIEETTSESDGDHVRVCVQREGHTYSVTAKKLIVTAGPWASALLPEWSSLLRVTRQLQGWISTGNFSSPNLCEPKQLPTWYLTSSQNKLPLYGIPTDRHSVQPDRIKMGIHLRDAVIDPSTAPATLTTDEWAELKAAGDFVFGHRCNKNMLSWSEAKPCLYTMSPDGHFIVGKPAKKKRIFAAAGLSGHGFKMTPALAQILVNQALGLGSDDSWKTRFISPSRYNV